RLLGDLGVLGDQPLDPEPVLHAAAHLREHALPAQGRQLQLVEAAVEDPQALDERLAARDGAARVRLRLRDDPPPRLIGAFGPARDGGEQRVHDGDSGGYAFHGSSSFTWGLRPNPTQRRRPRRNSLMWIGGRPANASTYGDMPSPGDGPDRFPFGNLEECSLPSCGVCADSARWPGASKTSSPCRWS